MQQRAIETRAKLLEAARELFAEKGLTGATVDEIAAKAQANKQRIYAYFKSKEGLFEAVLRDSSERVELFSRGMLKRAKEHPENLTAILIRGFLKVHAEYPYFWRLLAWANLEGPQCASALDQVRKQENLVLRELFNDAVARGLLHDVSYETYIFTLLSVTYFRYSNALTLANTLGWEPTGDMFETSLVEELNGVFGHGGK